MPTRSESVAHCTRRQLYGCSIQVSSGHGHGTRYTLLQAATIRMFYTDLLQPRARKALHTMVQAAVTQIFDTDILQPRAVNALHTAPVGSCMDILYGYPPVTNREGAAHCSRRELYEYSIRISSSHGQGKRYTPLQAAAIRIFYTGILLLRAGKELHTTPSGSCTDFYTDILRPRARKALHTAPSGSYTYMLYGYPSATGRGSATHCSKHQLYGYSMQTFSGHGHGKRYTLASYTDIRYGYPAATSGGKR